MAALAALGRNGEWELQGRTLKLTNLDKVLFPAGRDRSGIDQPAFTKRDLVAHYARVGPVMVPYLRGRALNMNRFPNGVDQPGFWHKAVPSHAPEWMQQWQYERASEGTTPPENCGSDGPDPVTSVRRRGISSTGSRP